VLEQTQVVDYLLRRGLLTPEAVVGGELVVRELSSRNSNFAVEASAGPSYLVKQDRSADGRATVAREAAVYQELERRGRELCAHLPRFVEFDPEEGALVLELLRDAEDLRARQLRLDAFPAALGRALGQALGTLHQEMWASYPEAPPPWILSIHRPDTGVFRDVSAANLELIKIVQNADGLGEALDELRAGWRVETLIHQDAKWDNFLVTPEDRLYLVDWELAVAGDPHWDLGSALSQYLSLWLYSIPVTGSEPPARFPALARHPLDGMKGALRATCEGYADAAEGAAPLDGEALRRATAYAGARLLQTAFEASQFEQRLDSAAILHLQLGANLMRRPEGGADELLGLTTGAPA
jgi:aminoglycoside phosphotransferase (APT) family kinase protein